MKPDYTYRCKVVRVTDADTIVLCIDMGLRMSATVPVRLVGVDAPELSTEAGKVARDRATAWLEARADRLVVATQKDPEKFGRWLGTIVDSSSGSSLNDWLVSSGHARRYGGGARG